MQSYPPPSVPPVRPGELLAGKYRVEHVLGAGGMGLVVAATHLELEQRVAVKFLLGQIASPEAVMRFVREARAAAKIKSEHVARVIDVGRLDDGSPYMVMEYLEGRDLAACLIDGPLPVDDAVDYVIQACDAMAEAHAEGIVHRDLKPANLFLSCRSDGSALVKVLDFGISKLATSETEEMSLTRTSAVMGSPMYMSPEQARTSRTVDRRTDIWSLGVILFELLSGRAPFRGQTLPELITAIAMDAPEPLRILRPDVPVELEATVLRCLTKDREQRFQTIGELVAALSAVAPRRSRPICERVLKLSGINETGGGLQSPRTRRPEAPPPETRTATSWAESNALGARGNRKLLFAVPAALVLLTGGFLLLRHPNHDASPGDLATPSARPEPIKAAATAPAPDITPVMDAPSPAASAEFPTLSPSVSAQAASIAEKPAHLAAGARASTNTAAANSRFRPAPAAGAHAPPVSPAPPASAAAAKPATPEPAPARRRGLDIDLK
jgi:serine/threonine protein kinase